MARRQRPNPSTSTRESAFKPSRVGVIATVLAVGLAGAIWWSRAGGARQPGPVVLISIDTLRADRLPIYGYSKGRTPALDRLAQESIVFDRAYAHAPQTLPSHTSIFTGQLPFEHKVRDNLGFALKDGAVTIAGIFRNAGYRTAAFVSAFVLRPETGVGQGFEVYDAEFPPAAADRSPAQVQRPGSSTLAAATKWLKSQNDDHFLLFFHIYEPHRPYAPPARYASGDPYDGEVSYSDEIVGSLLDVLKERRWYDEATIVLTADHGEGLGDHGEREHGLFLYDEVIRVPLLIKLPRSQHAPRRVTEPVQHIDLLPTLAELSRLPIPGGLRGRSLAAALTKGASIQPQGIYAEALYPRYHFGWSELLSLTDERYRYIKAPREELYDLNRDPKERTNILGERPQAAAALRSGLDGLVAGRSIDAPSPVTAADRERLAALGYVGTQSAAAAAPGETLPDPKDMAGVLRKYREAVDLIGFGKLEDGSRLLREILDEHPEMTDVWNQYGAVLVRMGRNGEALTAYQQVIKRRLDPKEASGPLGAAGALMSLGRLDEARAHAELAVSGAPASAHQTLANIAIAQKKYDEALKQAELARAADPTLPLPDFVRGTILHNQGRYAEAVVALEKARQAYSQRALQPSELYYLIGDSLAQQEHYREAEPYLLNEVRLYPGNVRAHAGLVLLYHAMERPADAERALSGMLRAAPNPASYDAASRIWRMFGQPQRAAAVDAEARKKFSR